MAASHQGAIRRIRTLTLAGMLVALGGCGDDTPAPSVTVTAEPEPQAPPSAPNDDAHKQAAIQACVDYAKKNHERDFTPESATAEFLHLSQDEFDHAPSNPEHLSRPRRPGAPVAIPSSSDDVTPPPPPGMLPPDRPLECWRVIFDPRGHPDGDTPQLFGRHYFVVQNNGTLVDCGIVAPRPLPDMPH